MRPKKHLTTLCLLLLTLEPCLWAQTPVVGRMPTKHYTSVSSLDSKRDWVTITQDRDGFMWFGHNEGVIRYDGVDIRDYRTPYSDCISNIQQDSKGGYWFRTEVVTQPGFLYYLPPDTDNAILSQWSTENGMPSDTIGGLLVDRAGRVWIGSTAGLCKIDNAGISIYTKADGILDDFVTSIMEDHEGTLWFVSRHGLTSRTGDHFVQHPRSLPFPHDIHFMAIDNDQQIWFVGGNGVFLQSSVYIYKNGQFDAAPKEVQARSKGVFQVMPGDDGSMWFAGWRGLYNLKNGKLIWYSGKNGLLEDQCFSTFRDREGTMWIGHVNGITKILNTGIIIFGKEDGLPSNYIARIFIDSQSNVWFACTGGLARLHGSNLVVLTEGDGLSSGELVGIVEDHDGMIWVSTSNGLMRLSQGRKKPNIETVVKTGATLKENNCLGLMCDREGVLWVGKEEGVSRITIQRSMISAENFKAPGLLRVIAITQDSAGAIWFATSNAGIFQWDHGNFVRFGRSQGFRSEQFVDAYCDPTGMVWFSSWNSGVYGLKDGVVIEHLGVRDGLPPSAISSVVRTPDLHLWISTEKGLAETELPSRRKTWYSTHHGLINNRLALDLVGDKFTASATNGAMIVDIKSLRPNTVAPLVRITGIYSDTIPHSFKNQFRVPFAQRDLFFNFVGLSFLDEHDVRYQSYLEGYDKEWSASSFFNITKYTNLDAGTYRFSVRAINRDETPSETSASVEFVVEPPFWGTWWFRSASVVALLMVGAAGYSSYVRKKLKQQEAIIERQRLMEQERTRISQDMHDSIGSSLTKIALMSEIINEEIQQSPSEVKRKAKMIADTSREVIEGMNEIIWSLNPRHDSVEGLVRHMRRYAGEILEMKEIYPQIQVSLFQEQAPLTPDFRRNVFLIFKEAVHNLVKHSEASAVDIKIETSLKHFFFTINDNGIGFDYALESKDGEGLRNMRTRSDRLAAELCITSQKGGGMSVTFNALLPVAAEE